MLRVGGPDLGRTLQGPSSGGGQGGACLGALVAGVSGGSPGPAPPPSAGMTLWVNGRAGLISSGGSVSVWQDQSGNGNDLPALIAPSVGSIKGKAAVSFSKAGSNLLTLPAFAYFGTTSLTAFFVWQYTGSYVFTPGTADNPCFLCQNSSSATPNCFGTGVDPSTSTDVEPFGCVTLTAGSPTVGPGAESALLANPHQTCVTWDGTSLGVSIDGGAFAVTPASGTIVNNTGNGRVGGGFISTDTFYNGEIGEMILYDRVLSRAEISSVQAYLTAQWGTLGP